MTDLAADLARAVGFLSRIPMPGRFFKGHDGMFKSAVRMFPVAGALISLAPALLFWLLHDSDPLLTSILVLGLMTLTAGALHEDGLADSADGLGGGRDREHALLIMKDSRIGAYGVIALILSFGLRAASLAAIARADASIAAVAFISSAALSRALMVAHWHALPPARPDGVAASAGMPQRRDRNIALALALGLALLLLGPAVGLPRTMLSLILAISPAIAFTRYVRRKIGGHTGDTIGAVQQVSDIALLVSLAITI